MLRHRRQQTFATHSRRLDEEACCRLRERRPAVSRDVAPSNALAFRRKAVSACLRPKKPSSLAFGSESCCVSTRNRFTALVVTLGMVAAVTGCAPSAFSPNQGQLVEDCLQALLEAPVATGVLVQPDDGREPVLEEFTSAGCTIDVSIYLLSDDEIIAALEAAADRGVRVRVMLEEHPFGGGGSHNEDAEEIADGGAEVRWSGSTIRFSHAKFALVDEQVALILNQNLTTASFTGNREFGVVTSDRAIVDATQEIFERDWAHETPPDIMSPLIMSPTNSRSRYLELIGDADRSIDFYAEVIRDAEIISALGDAERRGVAVRMIIDEAVDEDDQDVAAQLYDQGVDIRLAEHVYIHAKLMVIDRETAIVGSQNFTATSLDDNRELAVELTDPNGLARCLAVYERDWNRSVPGVPA